MFAFKLILAIVIVVANARHLPWEDQRYHQGYLLGFDEGRPAFDEDPFAEPEEFYHPGYLARARRQANGNGSMTLNSDGSVGLGAKIPLVETDKNKLSVIGSVAFDHKLNTASSGLGLALDNVNGHGLTVMHQKNPNFGNTLTGTAKFNAYNDNKHNVDVNAFVSRNMPDFPNAQHYNTVGGGLDYMYKNKVGASLGMSHTPFTGRNDYSAMGNLNLFRNPTSSVDFSGGFKRFDTPLMSSGWNPNFGLAFSRSF